MDIDYNPHAVLGLHPLPDGRKVIRLFRPGATTVHLDVEGNIVEALPTSRQGMFECVLPSLAVAANYRIFHSNGLLARDPYTFSPTCGEVDLHLFGKGVHYQLYHVLGSHIVEHEGARGVKFAVWAPEAKGVSLVGDFNHWDGRTNPMRVLGSSGVWELFVPGLGEGEKYKYEIHTKEGALLIKTDPYAHFYEVRPYTASIVFDIDKYHWKDKEWMEKRKARNWKEAPLNVYEVHLGSWKSGLKYPDLAHALADYCTKMHFTHVELLPILEHPLDESWGYQVTGFFAPTSRFGTPEEFQYFVDVLHQKGISVILDWVSAHFPQDMFSLARFDGSYLYEHADPKKGIHPHWNTHIFNYGRHEVSNFLIASALFWCEKMHIDGLRVDAVASMLYLDYGRKEGEWVPNCYGGKENLEAIEFLKHLNSVIHERVPGVVTYAEESTSFYGVCHPLHAGGLGFDIKWNLGWMNDTLRFFSKNPLFRTYHFDLLTFGLLYAFSEQFLLEFSHDEVVHGKGSLITKMPGDDWQKFAGVRLLYSYMMCQPGKKLIFMGAELGQWSEWNCKESIHWHLLDYERHRQLHTYFKEINQFYHSLPPLWERDFNWEGFEWVDFSDRYNCVISYLRKSSKGSVLCVHNFTPVYYPKYFVRLSHVVSAQEIFNTDRELYGGSGKINPEIERVQEGMHIQLAPLATMIIEVKW